jgi:hypothetical protein
MRTQAKTCEHMRTHANACEHTQKHAKTRKADLGPCYYKLLYGAFYFVYRMPHITKNVCSTAVVGPRMGPEIAKHGPRWDHCGAQAWAHHGPISGPSWAGNWAHNCQSGSKMGPSTGPNEPKMDPNKTQRGPISAHVGPHGRYGPQGACGTNIDRRLVWTKLNEKNKLEGTICYCMIIYTLIYLKHHVIKITR